MPPDRTRTLNTQGRQKACSECAKGKRKCSLGQPKCVRCTKQRLSCAYPPQPSDQSPTPDDDTLDAYDDLNMLDMSLHDGTTGRDAGLLDFGLQSLPANCHANLVDFDLSTSITSLDPLSNMLYRSPDGEDPMDVGTLFNGAGKTFSQAHVAPSAWSRVKWSVEQLKLAPRMMVEQSGTPWQHAMLYRDHMPRCLQDAYATCALYIARNGTNDEMVANFIKERVQDMVNSSTPHQPTELLARAHALMVYQIMLVFGGDISLYSQAEILLPLLDEVGNALLPFSTQQADPLGALPFYPSTAAHAAWTSYMFRESLRRTILSLYHFVTLCYLLRGSPSPCSTHLAQGNSVTLSAHLWDAKSSFEYAVAWNNEKHFLIQNLDFTEVMNLAEPKDVDTFGRMIMIGLQGEDNVRGWLYTKGGTL